MLLRGLCLAILLLCAGPAFAGIPANCSQQPPAGDSANAVVQGTFTGVATSGCFRVWGNFNVAIYGSGGPNGAWTASVQVERSFDGGTTWIVAGVGGNGAQAIYNTANQDVSILVFEPEKDVLYRVHCTSYSSGTINYRMSATGGSAQTWVPTR